MRRPTGLSLSLRLTPLGGQSPAGGDDTITNRLGQTIKIQDDVFHEDGRAFVR
jgi:hypothetical protein